MNKEDSKQTDKTKLINGFIDIDLMTKTECDTFIINLKLQIYKYYKELNQPN